MEYTDVLVADEHSVATMLELIEADPGLPRLNPTSSYWQKDPHSLANTQSAKMPQQVDYLVIGSGITGTSVAKTILDGSPEATVAMLEARTLCSGATGRNGGQLVTNAAEIFDFLSSNFGLPAASKITEFTLHTVNRMRELIAEYAPLESDFRSITKCRAYFDEKSFERITTNVKDLQESTPMARGMFSILEDPDKIYERYGVRSACGAITFEAGALSPYKLVTKILEALKMRYPSRFSIEANTPATAVLYRPEMRTPYKYVVQTPRGDIHAAKVLYCTNAYSGKLIPSLRGRIFPIRGTMSVQDLHDKVPNRGSKMSWSIHDKPETDSQTGASSDGLCYMTQHPQSGLFYFGGDKASTKDVLTADDAAQVPTSIDYLQTLLPKFFGITSDIAKGDMVQSWTGIMGFTADGLPLVGGLPESLSDKGGDGEWIAAGFNGYGMPYCWLAGEALAKMALGDKTPEWLPAEFLVTEARLSSKLTAEHAAKILYEERQS